FSEREVNLVTAFADQAVIAIENTRLFEEVQARTRELQEALDQQTATSEVVSAISSSHGALQGVFESLLANAVRLCWAKFGNLFIYEDGTFRHVALYGAPTQLAQSRRRNPVVRPSARSTLARIAATKEVQEVPDIRTTQAYLDRDPAAIRAQCARAWADPGGGSAERGDLSRRERDRSGTWSSHAVGRSPFAGRNSTGSDFAASKPGGTLLG